MTDLLLIDAARYAHILVVAIGFGVAFLADYQVLSRLAQPIDDALLASLDVYHGVIWKMILGMWITGLIMIGIRTGFDPANFTPKLIGKVVTVAILTANSALIGRVGMPLVRSASGRSLLWLSKRAKLMLAVIGGLSSASWMLALAMGSSKVLAAGSMSLFVVLLPAAYIAAVCIAVGVMFLASRLVKANVAWPSARGGLPRRVTLTPVAAE
jgi:hypothetical protein